MILLAIPTTMLNVMSSCLLIWMSRLVILIISVLFWSNIRRISRTDFQFRVTDFHFLGVVWCQMVEKQTPIQPQRIIITNWSICLLKMTLNLMWPCTIGIYHLLCIQKNAQVNFLTIYFPMGHGPFQFIKNYRIKLGWTCPAIVQDFGNYARYAYQEYGDKGKVSYRHMLNSI